MNIMTLGLLVGLALGFAAAFGGFAAFAIVAVLGAIGLGAGAVLDGRVDLGALSKDKAGRRDPLL